MLREFLERYRAAIASFTAVIVPLFLLYVHGVRSSESTQLERALVRVTAPVQAAASRMLVGVAGIWQDYVYLVRLERENDELSKRVDELEGEALRAEELALENERLRELLRFKRDRLEIRTLGARVIGEDLSPWGRVVRIALDVGHEHGVEPDMPVMTHSGLVGRIDAVSGRYAEVMLMVDARSSVSVRVAGKGVTGTVQGTGAKDVYDARFRHLQQTDVLAEGDRLVTSGHDGIFPPGIEVGYLRSGDHEQHGVYYEVKVVPAVDFAALQEVLVGVGDFGPTPEERASGKEGGDGSRSGGGGADDGDDEAAADRGEGGP